MAKPRTLDRILRVRTLQLGLTQAEEARAHERLASELALRNRIAQLADGVAPAERATDALSFIAAAHLRSRLQQSAVAADQRLQQAEAARERAGDATKAARRDQSAVEKLLERDAKRAALKELRALEEAPALRKVRHDPC